MQAGHENLSLLSDFIICRAAETFHRCETFEELFQSIAYNISHILDADHTSLFVCNVSDWELWSMDQKGMIQIIPFELGSLGLVAKNGSLLNLDDVENDGRFGDEVEERTGFRARSLLSSPIFDHAGEMVGILEVINKRNGLFSSQDEEVLQVLGRHISFSIRSCSNNRSHGSKVQSFESQLFQQNEQLVSVTETLHQRSLVLEFLGNIGEELLNYIEKFIFNPFLLFALTCDSFFQQQRTVYSQL